MKAEVYSGLVDNNGKFLEGIDRNMIRSDYETGEVVFNANQAPSVSELPNFLKSFGLKAKKDYSKRASAERFENINVTEFIKKWLTTFVKNDILLLRFNWGFTSVNL